MTGLPSPLAAIRLNVVDHQRYRVNDLERYFPRRNASGVKVPFCFDRNLHEVCVASRIDLGGFSQLSGSFSKEVHQLSSFR